MTTVWSGAGLCAAALAVTSLAASGQEMDFAGVAPLLERRCGACHRPRGVAPFSLQTYEDLHARRQAIRSAVEEDRMPPWHAAGPLGVFANDRRLPPEEKRLLLAWIDGGAWRGDRDPPKAQAVGGAWRIGEPDLVFELPEVVEVPAEGAIPYRYFRVATGLDRDVWVQAAEVVPGNRSVVHHAIVDYQPPQGASMPAAGQDPRTAGSLGSYVPGDDPLVLEPGVARRLPAGSELVFQMHYTASGKPERDRTRIGLVLVDEVPRWESRRGMASNPFIWIPAGDSGKKIEAEHRFEEDVYLLAMTPHMHLRGKAFEYRAVFPDGREELLLDVPRFDFDWQTTYRLREPRYLPAGTTIRCTGTYDNSAANPRNPDPTQNVSWGEQTWEEMMIGFFQYRPAAEIEPPS